jgi:hypothetical protein
MTRLLKLIRDHRRQLKTEKTVRDLGHGFKLAADGDVFLEDEIYGRMSLEQAINRYVRAPKRPDSQ